MCMTKLHQKGICRYAIPTKQMIALEGPICGPKWINKNDEIG